MLAVAANPDSSTAATAAVADSVPPPPEMAHASAPTGEEVSENDVVRVDTQLITVPALCATRGRPYGADSFRLSALRRRPPQRVATFATSDAAFEVALVGHFRLDPRGDRAYP